MVIAVPKEIMPGERRVAVTPANVRPYLDLGFQVYVESGAGAGVYASDEEYSLAGAKIIGNTAELFKNADIILKVKQPMFNKDVGEHEISMMKPGSTLVAFLHPAAPESHDNVRRLRDGRITSFTMDGIPRISRAQRMDALTSMSTCTGYLAMLDAAHRLPWFVPMMATAIGTVKPAKVLVVGCGVVGLQAVATAKRLGAVTHVFDIREAARTEGASLGAKIDGFDVPPEIAMAEGGYARPLPKDWLAKEREALASSVAASDIVILSALVPGDRAPVLITGEMVRSMKPGTVIIDVSVDQGGNCELTVPGKYTMVDNVEICGIQNIPGRLPVHSSWLYSSNLCYYIANMFKQDRRCPDYEDEIVANSLVTRDGKIMHPATLRAMGEV